MKVVVAAALAVVLGGGFGYGLCVYLYGGTDGFDTLAPVHAYESDPWLEPSSGAEQPRLEIDSAHAFLGPMSVEEPISHDFTLTNAGSAPLRLKAEYVFDMVNVVLKDHELAPGQSTTLNVNWEPESAELDGREIPVEFIAPFHRQIAITSNDPQVPRTLVSVAGSFIPATGISEFEFSLGKLKQEESRFMETQLYAYHTAELKILEPIFNFPSISKFFDVTWERIPNDQLDELPKALGFTPQVGYNIAIAMKPGIPMGRFVQQISVPVDPPSRSPIKVSISGEIESDVSMGGLHWNATHRAFSLGKHEPGEGVTRDVTLTFTGPHRHRINPRFKSVNPSWLEVEISEPHVSADDQKVIYTITATVPPDSPPVELQGLLGRASAGEPSSQFGSILIETDHPLLKTIDVRLIVVAIR